MSVFAPGIRLRDRFTLVERIGAGGMSEVWRARDDLLGRDVAVKALVAALATDPDLREATWREAQAVARLNHPNVAQVHDYGEVPLPGGGVAGYLVMELVAGQSLAERLAGGPLPWPEAARVGVQVAAALAAAHRLGVVHRDVKPGNVMLTDAGVKVLDFGISAVAGRVDADPGRLLGTPRYAAPERLDPAHPAAPASDVYSLGVLLYETLPGTGLPDRVARLCRACVSSDPAQRPTAAQVASVLAEAAGDGGRRTAPTVPLPPDEVPGARRGRQLRLAGLAAVVLAVGLGVALLVAAMRSDDRGPSEEAGGASPAPAVSPAAAPPPAAPPPVAPPPAAPPPAAPAPGDPTQVVAEFDRAVIDLLEQQAITRDAYDDLRGELDGLRDALDEEPADRDQKLRDEAEDLGEELDDLRADGEIDQNAADRLAGLLEPLLGG